MQIEPATNNDNFKPILALKPRSVEVVDTSIGKRIEERRVIMGISRKHLAEKLGITHQQLHKYERGVNRISASRLLHLADFLNTPIGYFYQQERAEYKELEDKHYREVLRALHDFTQLQHPRQNEILRLLIRILSDS